MKTPKFLQPKGKKNAGFTLVESMVAITILSLSITGPLLIAQKGVSSAIYARDQITAFYLAQEAVEYIRNVRDTNRIADVDWLNGLTACRDTGAGQRCHIDSHFTDFTQPGAISACDSTCNRLSFYENAQGEGYYGYSGDPGWTPVLTPFTRTVSIDDRLAPGREAVISVEIRWKTNLFDPERVFTVREHVFDF